MTENEIGKNVVDAAIAVHRELGPGLLETVYEVVLADELRQRGLKVERQMPVPITCRGIRFDEGFRADIVIEGKVILELKSIPRVNDAHKKQLLTYLKLTRIKLGFLFNFGEAFMKNGITRIVNGLEENELILGDLSVLTREKTFEQESAPYTPPTAGSETGTTEDEGLEEEDFSREERKGRQE